MKNILDITDLEEDDIYQIWRSVKDRPDRTIEGNIAWSFEGNGIRTRTTFQRAFQRLGLSYVELPNFLKTSEIVEDLAGYMDPFINAMSGEAHPCEVLTDGYYLNSKFESISELRILLWGPVTNVFKSWSALSKVLGLNLTHISPEGYELNTSGVTITDIVTGQFDVIVTDAWPSGFTSSQFTLTEKKLLELGSPLLLPTPPVTIGQELSFIPSSYDGFAGFAQKSLLLPVQEAIISHTLKN